MEMNAIFFTGPFDEESLNHQAKRADQHLHELGLGWICTLPNGTPARTASMEFEARSENLLLVKRILTQHYGFQITRTEKI